MIYGIGTDIVRVSRMQANLGKHAERFVERILSINELKDFDKAAKKAHFLAKRFAAKEAISKAMGFGFSNGLSLTKIEIMHDKNGKPMMGYLDSALKLKEELGIGDAHISLSDEDEYAIAFVTLMKAE